MKHSYRNIIAYLVISTLYSGHLYACIITFFNDGPGSVLIADLNNDKKNMPFPPSLTLVPKGTSRRIGKATEHAHFLVYTKQQKGNVFTATYEIQQNECGKNGNPYIKLSDVRNRTGLTNLFNITEVSKGHTSMVRQLPSLQRADVYREEMEIGTEEHCSSCIQ